MDARRFLSDIDCQRFGLKIARVDGYDESPERIINALKLNNVGLVISRIKVSEAEFITGLEKLGFKIMDRQFTYRFRTDDINFETTPKVPLIRDIGNNDEKAMVSIAERAFWNYGHYAADDRLDIRICNDVYKDWTRRSIHDRRVADKVLVAEINGEVAGFLSFKIISQPKSRFAKGIIGAVDEQHRNKNIFGAMAKAGIVWAGKNELEWCEHNVLAENLAVKRSLSKIGFDIADHFVTMHLWLDG